MNTPPGEFSLQHALVAVLGAAALVYAAAGLSDRMFGQPQARVAVAEARPTPTPVVAPETPEPTHQDVQRKIEQRAAEEEALRRERAAAVRQAQAEAAAALQAEQAQKETAWKRYYRRPAKCESPADDKTFVECGNHYLRAQERFERDYAAGKLR